MAANGERSALLFMLARLGCIPFSLLGCYVCHSWAKRLYGEISASLALALWCFCPNLLGHGSLTTADVPATALGVAACYCYWLWLTDPSWTRALVTGTVLGLAELTKMTLVVLPPLWVMMWLAYRSLGGQASKALSCGREFGMLSAAVLLALYVLNLGYGFEGSFTPLGDFKFVSASLGAERGAEKATFRGGNRFACSWLAELPVPLPKYYVLGMDLQRRDFEDYQSPSYLGGKFSPKGWWYYYLYALAIKVPLGTCLLFLLATVAPPFLMRIKAGRIETDPCKSRPSVAWRDEVVLLCPAAAILVVVSSQTGFSEHMRYVLPAFPFVFIWIARLGPLFGRRHMVLTGIAGGALAWTIGSSLSVYPHSLSYFNELVGGPMGGPNHLIHSNVDWGQDLFFLKDWLKEHPEAQPLKLAYFGYCDPRHFGVEYTAPDPPKTTAEGPSPTIDPGWYAISVNFVRGLPYFSYKGDGTKVSYGQDALVAFQRLEPVATAGYSIYIYHVE